MDQSLNTEIDRGFHLLTQVVLTSLTALKSSGGGNAAVKIPKLNVDVIEKETS